MTRPSKTKHGGEGGLSTVYTPLQYKYFGYRALLSRPCLTICLTVDSTFAAAFSRSHGRRDRSCGTLTEFLQKRLSNYMPVPSSKACRDETASPVASAVWHRKDTLEIVTRVAEIRDLAQDLHVDTYKYVRGRHSLSIPSSRVDAILGGDQPISHRMDVPPWRSLFQLNSTFEVLIALRQTAGLSIAFEPRNQAETSITPSRVQDRRS
jgi:hypothetical protein